MLTLKFNLTWFYLLRIRYTNSFRKFEKKTSPVDSAITNRGTGIISEAMVRETDIMSVAMVCRTSILGFHCAIVLQIRGGVDLN